MRNILKYMQGLISSLFLTFPAKGAFFTKHKCGNLCLQHKRLIKKLQTMDHSLFVMSLYVITSRRAWNLINYLCNSFLSSFLPSLLPSFLTYLLTDLLTYLLTYLLTDLLTDLRTYSRKQSPSWEANQFSASQ